MQQNMVKLLGSVTVSFLVLGSGVHVAAYAGNTTSEKMVVTEGELAQLEVQLKDLSNKSQTFTSAVMQASNEYTNVQYEKSQLEIEIENLENKIAENADTQKVVEQKTANLVGEMYRAGSGGSVGEVFLEGTESLHSGVLAEKLNNSHEQEMQEVLAQQQDHKALLVKLENQKAQLQKAEADSAVALFAAQRLAEDQKVKESELATEREVLITRLAVLRETSAEEERQLQAEREEQARQAELAAQLQASVERESARVQEEQAAAVRAQEQAAAQAPAQQAPAQQAPTAQQAPAQQAPTAQQAPAQPAPVAQTPAAPAPSAGAGYTEQAISYALAQVGKSYVFGASGPGAFDCSGLVMQAFGSAGRNLPRVSGSQYSNGTPIPFHEKQRGDLIFWSYGAGSANFHVAIYLGDNKIVHAATPSLGVIQDSLFTMPGANIFVARM